VLAGFTTGIYSWIYIFDPSLAVKKYPPFSLTGAGRTEFSTLLQEVI
jgi:hypothetical protein